MGREYITALKESLEKKLKVLDEIYRISGLQQDLMAQENPDYEVFDRYVDDKDICLEKLEFLDEGFDITYNRVKEELEQNKAAYASEIRAMQDLIRKISERSVSIQAMEERNRRSVEEHFARDRRQARDTKRSVSVAMNYYRSMNGMVGTDTSAKLDSKK